MPMKSYNPTTPSRRFMSVVSREEITKQTPEKIAGGGQEAHRRAQQRRAGFRRVSAAAGPRRLIATIDFKRDKFGIPAKVAAIEYDPNRIGAHRAAALCRRREALHRLPGGPDSGPHGELGRRKPTSWSAMRCR